MAGNCTDCGHAALMHYDGRGCHCENCRCETVYRIKSTRVSPENYQPLPIPERKIEKGSTYLDSLWQEIRDWHGDILA